MRTCWPNPPDGHAAWQVLGSPLKADDAQFEALLKASDLPTPETTTHKACPDTLSLKFDMSARSIVLIVVQGDDPEPWHAAFGESGMRRPAPGVRVHEIGYDV